MDAKEWREKVINENEIDCKFGNVNPSSGCPASGQYAGIIYWVHIDFDDNYLNTYTLKEEYKDAGGINIMPYTITKQDMLKAELKSKDFNDRVNKNADLVDFDYKDKDKRTDEPSYNFHKKPGGNIQFVLTKGKGMGPGPSAQKTEYNKLTLEGTDYYVKKDWYFDSNIPVESTPETIRATIGAINKELKKIGNQIFK